MTEIEILKQDHEVALREYNEAETKRNERKAQAYGIHVTCMDERDTFSSDATGEPLGFLDLFASPGGCLTQDRDPDKGAKALLGLYGQKILDAKAAGKKIVIYLIPHSCAADNHAGCAAFKSNEEAERIYFAELALSLELLPELSGAEIFTCMYDTDSHQLVPFGGSETPALAEQAADRLRNERGLAGADGAGDWDRFHAGNRIYVGDLPRAWTPRRNAAYHLHNKMNQQELIDGIALACKIIKTHSHVNLDEKNIAIQLDLHPEEQSILSYSNQELIEKLNSSLNLKDLALDPAKVIIIRTQTDPNTWQGEIINT